ncbi:cysteine synthase family protein [Clostridium sp. 19966]|uniref:PLP-dependent cysteine synthase family protein n=1 Tax=Clostridium sp. 19966 TaxID=2768166 RepID=UPI0028E026E1|nr:cysteine synthase family protein [Clostridium sp. 19966]MDT8717859.1 cysteine synthase family protein [Clostridium sp. 19966]
MNYIEDVRELVGNTPLLKLNNFKLKENVTVFAKLEQFNPGGSIRDRVGIYMIREAEKAGILKKGDTIIEVAFEDTAIGIAFAAINKGYKTIFVAPENFSIEKQIIIRTLGAKVINTPAELEIKGALIKAKNLLKTIENSVYLSGFYNPRNPEVHYNTTAPEIYSSLEGNIDYFIASNESEEIFRGISKYLKERKSSIKSIIAKPEDGFLSEKEIDIGNTKNINFKGKAVTDERLVDRYIRVKEDEIFNAVGELAKTEGLLVGTSSGVAMAAALKLAKSIRKGNIVVIFPDGGERYFSKNIFSF